MSSPDRTPLPHEEDREGGSLHRACPGDDRPGAIGVGEGWRGQGIGTALLKQAEDHANKQGKPYLTLETSRTNRAAIRLYRRLGFVVVRQLPSPLIGRLFGTSGWVLMRKNLWKRGANGGCREVADSALG